MDKSMKKLIAICLICCSSSLQAAPAAIASAHPMATLAGERILAQGGNAFDAAVAMSAALAVVEPYSSGIGGGGFYLLHRQSDGYETMIDAREKAPLNSHRDMYLNESGEVIKNASISGALSAGIPGVPAALEMLSRNYGRLSLRQNLQPAIGYAINGFKVDEHYQRMASFRLSDLQASEDAAKIFLRNNEVPEIGVLIRQPELANTLGLMAQNGAQGFYAGEVADKLIAGVKQHGGIWSKEDLEKYSIVERKPITGHYLGMKITSAAPPSSGGIAIVEILNQLSNFKLGSLEQANNIHLIVEAMRRAYRDRAEFLGDTDFVSVPIDKLINKNYAAGLAAGIHPQRATPSDLLPGIKHVNNSKDTTHFSIIDHQGNRVSATLSINYPFGSCFVVPGTGVLLNDEMDDFSAKPGVPNAYGLVGAEANSIEPGKRMLSSMTPTFLETDDRLAIIGTPGGSRIITMVLLASLRFYLGEDALHIVNGPRFHHQYLPDRVFYEANAFSREAIENLKNKKHNLTPSTSRWGNMQLVIWDKKNKKMSAASDARGIGLAKVIMKKN